MLFVGVVVREIVDALRRNILRGVRGHARIERRVERRVGRDPRIKSPKGMRMRAHHPMPKKRFWRASQNTNHGRSVESLGLQCDYVREQLWLKLNEPPQLRLYPRKGKRSLFNVVQSMLFSSY